MYSKMVPWSPNRLDLASLKLVGLEKPLMRPSIRFLKYVSNFFLLSSGIVEQRPQMTAKINRICRLMVSTCKIST